MLCSRETSLLRKLIPFTFHACGPVRDVIRGGFERHPHFFGMALEALEELDTAPQARVTLAEALQAVMLSRAPSRELREAFHEAEDLARAEFNGEMDYQRVITDPVYKLTIAQLHMAAGYWARMLGISHTPWVEADVFVHHRYSTDVRDCEVITPYVMALTSEAGRATVDDRIGGLIKDLVLLERDLWGQWRLDKRSDRVFILHKLLASDIDKSWDTFGVMDLPVIQEHGHWDITSHDGNRNGRWKFLSVRCRPETEPEPWAEWLDVPALSHPGAREVLREAGDSVSAAVRDALLEGRVRIHVDSPILPRRGNVDREALEFKLELPVVTDDPSMFARLLRERSNLR